MSAFRVGPGAVSPGQIRFYDSIQPPLRAGDYTLSAEQQVLQLKGEGEPPTYTAGQDFRVDGPRYALDPATIHMVFPPANQAGSFVNVLPTVVFNSFALPWSRPIDPRDTGEPGPDTAPWMGLLTVYDAEMDPEQGTPKVGPPTTVTPIRVVQPEDPAILPPCIPLDQVDPASQEKVLVVDMELAFFQSIAPSLAELPFLAHAREVNTAGKVLLGMQDDGCFALVVGNRVVLNGGRSTFFLVSFEGHQNHLNGAAIATCDGGQPAQPYTKIRLVVLGTWSFRAASTLPGSFLDLMQALYLPGRGGVELLALPVAQGTEDPTAKEGLEVGFVALRNELRVGEFTTSWYHGPFAAAPTLRDQVYGPYLFSDHAIHYDPASGLFDHAYAAAWQIGRLLALSDSRFAAALFAWRRDYFADLVRRAAAGAVEGRVAGALEAGGLETPADEGVVGMMRRFMLDRIGPMADRLPRVRPRHLAGDGLSGVLSADEAAELAASGDDPLLALRDKLTAPPLGV
ncbi:MAG TPA: hypothetical protein VF006_17580 [Longimicrobium sp.]